MHRTSFTAAAATGALLLATPAAAQVATNCNLIGQQIFCTSSAPQPSHPVDQTVALQVKPFSLQVREAAEAQEAQLRARQAHQAQIQAEYDRSAVIAADAEAEQRQVEADERNRRVGALVAHGDCEEAKTDALESGDFDLATRVKELCVPAQAHAEQRKATEAKPAPFSLLIPPAP
jgi:hypothetical protein